MRGSLRRDRCVRKETAVGVCYGWMGGVVWVSEQRQVCTEGDCGGCMLWLDGWGCVGVWEETGVYGRRLRWVYVMVGWVGLCGCLTRDSSVKEKLGCVCTVCTKGWRRAQ
jgi:hypothetical protein